MRFKKTKNGLKRRGWYCCLGMTYGWNKDLICINETNVCIAIAVEGSKYNIVEEEIYFCPWCGEEIIIEDY